MQENTWRSYGTSAPESLLSCSAARRGVLKYLFGILVTTASFLLVRNTFVKVHSVAAMATETVQVVCPTCKSCTATRISRRGFLQERIMPRLGYYPWKCGECGCSFLCRSRGHDVALSRRHRPRSGVTG